MLIANARMYSVNATVASAWRTLLEWVIARAGVECEVVDYPAPRPLPALWARTDAGCVFMCGYPIARAARPPRVLAAPVPAPSRYRGRPVYCTDIVVRADASASRLEDIFGQRFAFTTEDSQSGYQAPRSLLAPFASARGGPLFAAAIGPLVTPHRVVEAVLAGEADAGPIDSYFHDLLRHHEPAVAKQLRVLTSTGFNSIPALIAAPAVPDTIAARLTEALLAVGDAADLAEARADLLLRRFVAVGRDDYGVLRDSAQAADQLGYVHIA